MTTIREVRAEGWCVRLAVDRQVLRLDIPEPDWPSTSQRSANTPLDPVLPLPRYAPVSAAMLLLKSKQLDDRLCAAVELAAQHGTGRFAGKAKLLRTLAATLASGLPDTAHGATVIHAACELGGVTVAIPEAIADAVGRVKADFLRDALLAKPLGFYAGTPELSAIFRQDRFLQQPLALDVAEQLDRAVEQTPGASDARAACLLLNERLTNPPKRPSIYDLGKRPPFFPPSRSYEVTLFENLYEDRPIPAGYNLMSELIRRVRSGEIRLEPTDGSGWYDRQVWALEPLLTPDRAPEATHLELGRRYRKHLEDLFRGALALTRETHVKQDRGGRGGYGGPSQPPIWIHPNLTVEPLPTLYSRRAAGYRFVRSVLEDAFGSDALSEMHQLTHDGTTRPGLGEELAWVEQLFTGASATASQELGMGLPQRAEAAARCFSAWRGSLRSDADLGRDSRMMVPVFHDMGREKTKVWAMLGWRTVWVESAYRVAPTVRGIESLEEALHPSREPPDVRFGSDRFELAVPVMAEAYVERLLDRDEFRRHCDRYQTKEAILAHL